MRLINQSKLHAPKDGKTGNCMATVLACVLDMDVEDVPNIETLFCVPGSLWYTVMTTWLFYKGYALHTIPGHLYNNEFYFVSGKSARGVMHICIYKNGSLFWDTHPSGDGIKTEEIFEQLQLIINNVA